MASPISSAEAGAVDEQVAFDHLARGQRYRAHVAVLMLVVADDLALDALHAARLAQAAQVLA
jgi:hypothetical protein